MHLFMIFTFWAATLPSLHFPLALLCWIVGTWVMPCLPVHIFFGNEGTSFELRTARISGFEDHKFTDLVDLPVLRLPDLSEKCGFQAANFNC